MPGAAKKRKSNPKEPTHFRVAVFDIEATHLKADFGFMLCAAVKIIGGPLYTFRIDDYAGYKREPWNDRRLVLDVRDFLEAQDLLVSYNGKRFDVPFLQSRLAFWREDLMEPKLHVDMLYTVRHKLLLHSGSLESAQAFFGYKNGKTTLMGDIWVKASHGHRASLEYVVDHCERDVLVLERLFLKLKPFLRGIWKG